MFKREDHNAKLDDSQVTKRVISGISTVFFRHAGVRVLSLISSLILAGLLDPRTFGVFAIGQFAYNALNSILIGGTATALLRRHGDLPIIEVESATVLQFGAAILGCVLVWIAFPIIHTGYRLSASEALAACVVPLAIIPIALRSAPQVLLQRIYRHDLVSTIEAVEYLFYAIMAVLLAYLKLGIWALVIATIGRQILGATLMHLAAHYRPHFRSDRAATRRLVGEAAQYQLIVALDTGSKAIIPIVAGYLFGPAVSGLINFAALVVDALAGQPLALVANIQFRLMAQLRGEREKLARFVNMSYWLCSFVFAPTLILFAVVGPLALSFAYGHKWAGAGPYIVGLSLVALFQIFVSPSSQALKALGLRRSAILVVSLNGLVQCGLLLLLAPKFGGEAYIVAAAAGVFCAAAINVVTLMRAIPIAPLRSALPNIIYAAIGVTPALLVPHNDILPQAAALVAAPFIYLTLVVLFSGKQVVDYIDRLNGTGALTPAQARLLGSVAGAVAKVART